MEGSRQGLRDFTHRRRERYYLDPEWEQLETFQASYWGSLQGKRGKWGREGRVSEDLTEERGDRRTKGHGIKK